MESGKEEKRETQDRRPCRDPQHLQLLKPPSFTVLLESVHTGVSVFREADLQMTIVSYWTISPLRSELASVCTAPRKRDRAVLGLLVQEARGHPRPA